MNTTHRTLVTLLSSAIGENKAFNLDIDNINWKEVYDYAEAHAVSPLIYPMVKKLSKTYEIDDDLIAKWSKSTIFSGIYQTQHINQMKKVFNAFKEAGIPVVALKGLILRELYPRPELRTMSDSDLLIKKDCVVAAEKVLVGLGYSKSKSIGHESCFVHHSALAIDLHWSLTNEDHLKNVEPFEDTIWQNLRPYDFHAVEILALSKEYELMHLFIHIASHMIKSGFGVRQLCDIVVFIEKEQDNIDWILVYDLGKVCKLNKLISTILIICKNLFSLEPPKAYSTSYPGSEEYINFFTNEILESGVYGAKDEDRAASIMMFGHSLKANDDINKFKLMLRYLFPAKDKLDKRFSYGTKHPSLLVLAWIHRLVYVLLFNSSMSLKKLFKLRSTASLVQDRFELIKWLQL